MRGRRRELAQLVYVYCVTSESAKEEQLSFPSDDVGFGAPRKIAFEDISAIASDVSSSDFSQDRVHQQMNDPLWLARTASRHELAIECLMNQKISRNSTPVPMKLCTIFRSDERVSEMLAENYARFKLALRKVNGKVELGVTGFSGNQPEVKEKLASRSSRIKELREKIEHSTPGKSYFLKRELNLAIAEESTKSIIESTNTIMNELRKYSVLAVANEPLANNISQSKESEPNGTDEMRMILNHAYLVRRTKVATFKSRFEKLQNQFTKKGLVLKVTGPWPPYNFV